MGGKRAPNRARTVLRQTLAQSLALALSGYAPALAAESAHVRNSFGDIGMLDMPSAHMAGDGQLALTVGTIGKTQRYNLTFQAVPWLETSFRYSHYAPGTQSYDRSFGLKARLLTEENSFADLSVGVRDLLGTGIYSSEFVALSKHVGSVDFTTGMGWGRLADTETLSNPLGIIPSFRTRGAAASLNGGDVNFGQFFRGHKVGLFGGAIWQTPLDGLRLIAEYSSDRYIGERTRSAKSFPVRTPVNLGFSYQVMPSLSLGAGWYYGSTYGVTLSLGGDPTADIGSEGRIGPAVPPSVLRTDAQQRQAVTNLLARNVHDAMPVPVARTEQMRLDLSQALLAQGRGVRDLDIQGNTVLIDASVSPGAAQCANYARIVAATGFSAQSVAISDLENGEGEVVFCPVVTGAATKAGINREFEREVRAGFAQQSLTLEAISLGSTELWVYYENGRYRSDMEAAGRAIRILMREAPSSVELFHLFPLMEGKPTREIEVARSTMERTLQGSGSPAEIMQAVSLKPAPLNNPVLNRAAARTYPRFEWALLPGLGDQLFDPNRPLQVMLYADALARLRLAPGLSLNGDFNSILWNNYTFGSTAPNLSTLPHVRTDVLNYLDTGRNGIGNLTAEYETRLSPDVFIKAKSGLLEDMFAGAGGEILWRPEGSRLAFGADAYQVWQRNFDRLFGVQPYHVLTGHVSVYYQTPWYGINLAAHGGRYLAGDYGATFEITRRFASGVEVGAFATFTNVPYSTFGEGSFDKGIIIRIPLQWALPIYTQTSYNVNLHSLTRDGGQRLFNDDSLYRETLGTSYGEFAEHMGDVAQP